MKENSIEEDIERLKLCSTNQCYICGRYEKEECMLERNRCEQHILSDYKRVLQKNEKYKQFFDLMLRLDSDYFMNCGDEGTIKLVDEILKLESE